MFQGREVFAVYENHQYGIVSASPELEVLAKSQNSIAVIKHKERSVYGFQFHPEHLTDQQFGDEVFLQLFQLLTR